MRKYSSLAVFGGIIVSTDGWKQGLLHLQQNLQKYSHDFEQAPAACHAFFSPEPIRQHRYFPDANDFHELYTLHHGHLPERVPRSCNILRRDRKTVEALYMLFPEKQCNKTALSKYQSVSGDLLDIIFGSEAEARRLLDLAPTESKLPPSTLWTLLLFRLATQRIDGFGLSPCDARNDGNVYQTLWPVAPSFGGQYESISFDDPLVNEQLLLPKLYKGAVWVLNETSGIFHVPSGESIPCTIRFSPPLLLFGSPPDISSPIYHAWTGDASEQTISITKLDGSLMDGFGMKRIRGLGLLFSREDDRSESPALDDEFMNDKPQFVGDTAVCEVELRPLNETAIKTSRSIPLRMVFLAYDDPENIYLLVKPEKSENPHLPVLQPLKPDAISTQSFSLAKAESLLEAVHCRKESCFAGLPMAKCLPQQRITNVVQFLDNLFEASSKAVTIALAMGRDWIKDNMSRTAPTFTKAWREGEYSSAECRALVERIRESANMSDGQGGDTDGSSKDGNSLRSPSDSDYDGQISLIPPKQRQGRRRHPRRAWIQERLDEGLEVEGIINAWNQGGPELWKKIDPKNPKDYLVKTSDQLKASKKRIRSLISRMEEDKEKEKKQNSTGD